MILNSGDIDQEATKRKVEEIFKRYRMYLLMEPIDLQPKITSSFQLTPPSDTNKFHSDTETIAIKRVKLDKERKDYISWVIEAVNRLNYEERTAIIKRYLMADDVYDYEVYNKLGYSERKYYRIKSSAFDKLAFIFRVEVYKGGDKQ